MARRPRYPATMDPDFWRTRWAEGRIGWHQDAPNAHLVAHAALFDRARRVFVPLCGKSLDLAWIAARPHAPAVVGVELVEDAARELFEEHGLTAERVEEDGVIRYRGGSIEIVVGDYFALGADVLGHFDACFDRAALVAMPPAQRPRYVAHQRGLLAPGARTLLVTFVHDAPPDSPPFSVPEAEVRALYEGCRLTLLGQNEELVSTSLLSRGVKSARELVFAIEA